MRHQLSRALLPRQQRGVSLIEALVAMAIMAFGMLGVLGMQASLRANGDIAKQRSEAVRIAQATMEDRRAFSVLDSAAGNRAFADILPVVSTSVAQANANTLFEQTQTVVSFPGGAADKDYLAARKTIKIDVNWLDRNSVQQTVSIGSIIAGNAPEIVAALATPATGSLLQNPGGRHLAVPRGAVNLGNGTSQFTPPSAPSGVSWIFANNTGYLKQTCLGVVCTDFTGRLLAGFVRFSTATNAVDSRNPVSTRLEGVSVEGPGVTPAPPLCYVDQSNSSYLAYFCAVRFVSAADLTWTGTILVNLGSNPLTTSMGPDPGKFRVCRYTTARTNLPTPPVPNDNHPYTYVGVREPLLNQNFLVMSAEVPAGCPDDTELPGRTMDHQPAT